MSKVSRPNVDMTNRGYHNKESAYILPNDASEHDRLEAQAAGLRMLGGDKVIHAPLSAPAIHKALDIGCGTGVVAHELSSKFPDAQVYGVDLSPVPSLREKLKNTEYVEGDIFELAGGKNQDSRFGPASFDYVFSRFLVMGMTEWKKYVELCASLTAPGGWVEMHDLDIGMTLLPENTPPSDREAVYPTNLTLADMQHESPAERIRWQKKFYKLLEIKRLDPAAGFNLAQHFANAGLEDIHIRRILLPFGNNDDWTDAEKQYIPHSREVLTSMVPGMLKKMKSDLGVSDAEAEDVLREAREHLDVWEGGRDFMWIYVVCGRKPL